MPTRSHRRKPPSHVAGDSALPLSRTGSSKGPHHPKTTCLGKRSGLATISPPQQQLTYTPPHTTLLESFEDPSPFSGVLPHSLSQSSAKKKKSPINPSKKEGQSLECRSPSRSRVFRKSYNGYIMGSNKYRVSPQCCRHHECRGHPFSSSKRRPGREVRRKGSGVSRVMGGRWSKGRWSLRAWSIILGEAVSFV